MWVGREGDVQSHVYSYRFNCHDWIVYGENTNGVEIVSNLERQAEYAVRMVRRMQHENVTAIEVRPTASRWYNRWLQKRMEGTLWTTTHTYFTSASAGWCPSGLTGHSSMAR